MKWIGQHIWDFISRFRNDVYLENIADGTVANDKFLGLDSNNKIVKETATTTVSGFLVDDDDDVIDTDLPVVDSSQDAQNISVRNQNGITTGNKININYESPSQVQPKKDGVTLIPYPGAKSTFIKNEHLPEYHNPTIVDKDSLIQAVFNKTNKPVVGHDGPGETLDAFLLTYNPRIRKKITKLLRKFWKLNDNKKIKEANAIGQEILSFINQIDKNKKMKYPVIGYTAGMIGQP